MLNVYTVPMVIDEVEYEVFVEMPTWSSGYVVDIKHPNGVSIPPVDWDAHKFDDFTLELCVLKALKA
jgi:hypothetical protein